MADLSKAFQCYAIDTLGDFGKSRPARLPASRADYADWLLDVFDALQLDKADIAGLSYGGFLAVNFALAFPKRVRRIVLMAPGIPNFGPMTLQWANYGMPMILLPSRTTIRRFIRGVSTKGYQADDPVYEQMIVGLPQLQHPTFVRPVFSDEELRELRAPTLLLIGDHEILYEPRKAVKRARQLVPTMQAELVPNAGHMLNSDQPAIVDERMLQFLSDDMKQGRDPQ